MSPFTLEHVDVSEGSLKERVAIQTINLLLWGLSGEEKATVVLSVLDHVLNGIETEQEIEVVVDIIRLHLIAELRRRKQ